MQPQLLAPIEYAPSANGLARGPLARSGVRHHASGAALEPVQELTVRSGPRDRFTVERQREGGVTRPGRELVA